MKNKKCLLVIDVQNGMFNLPLKLGVYSFLVEIQ